MSVKPLAASLLFAAAALAVTLTQAGAQELPIAQNSPVTIETARPNPHPTPIDFTLPQENAAGAVAPQEINQHGKAHPPPPYIDFELTGEKSFTTASDAFPPRGSITDAQILLSGQLRINMLPRLSAFVRRVNHFDVDGRTYNAKQQPVYSGEGWDLEYQYGLTYELLHDLNFSEFYRYRWRVCCPNAGQLGNESPRVEQGLESLLDYRIGPKTVIGRPLELYAGGFWVDHHRDLGVVVPKGEIATGNLWLYDIGGYANFPVFGANFVPYVGAEHYEDYFNNNIYPAIINRSYIGARFANLQAVTYRAYIKNERQVGGNASHKVTLYLEATLHVRR